MGCQVFEVSFVHSGRRLSRLRTRPLPRQLAAARISATDARLARSRRLRRDHEVAVLVWIPVKDWLANCAEAL